MPPRAGNKKKAVVQAAEPPAKKPKVDPACEGIAEAVEKATDLPENVRKMLLAALPWAMGVHCDERHETQQSMVKMIGDVVRSVETKMVDEVDVENAKIADFEARKEGLEADIAKSKEHLAKCFAGVEAKAAALESAAQATEVASAALAKRQEEQRTGDASMVEAQEIKAALERGMETELRLIIEGQSDEAVQLYTSLQLLFKHLELDDSLTSALPSSCGKKFSERGCFDTMVLQQISTQFQEKVASLAKVVSDGEPAAQERAAAVASAQGEADRMATSQQQAKEEVATATAAEQSAKEAVGAAEAALASYGPEYAKASLCRDEKAEVLNNFRSYNVACFEVLRDQTSPKATSGGA